MPVKNVDAWVGLACGFSLLKSSTTSVALLGPGGGGDETGGRGANSGTICGTVNSGPVEGCKEGG